MVRPETIRNESLSVVKVMSLVELGIKATGPLAVKVSPEVIVRLLLTVVVPELAPIAIVVAAPPMFKVVAVVLKSEAVEVVVVMSAEVGPLTARSPEAVTSPVKVDAPSTVKVPLVWILPSLAIEAPVEP